MTTAYRTFAWLGHAEPTPEQRKAARDRMIDIDYLAFRDPMGGDPMLGIAGFYDGVFTTDPILAALAVAEDMAVATFYLSKIYIVLE